MRFECRGLPQTNNNNNNDNELSRLKMTATRRCVVKIIHMYAIPHNSIVVIFDRDDASFACVKTKLIRVANSPSGIFDPACM